MTYLLNTPEAFASDMLAGFLDANSGRVRGVSGGVVRAAPAAPGKVSVVIGGGSGHYPAFIGLVGPGLADAAAVGDVFASPSSQPIVTAAHSAHHGAGVVLMFGNYAGDVLNFGTAATQLRAAGLDVRSIAVGDDIASAPPEQRSQRRGIAGDLVVFKVAGAAAETGRDLDEVERIARRCNERTHSLGVAFGGCTLPGASRPLFTVPAGSMAVGMGIHGEPGISLDTMPTAHELAELLVERLLRERPADADGRAAVVLNGLGTTKYEELFVLWRSVAPQLATAGVSAVAPEIGELVTSLDMTGCSLTLSWLDDELTDLWLAPADTPAFRRGPTLATHAPPDRATTAAPPAIVVPAAPPSLTVAPTQPILVAFRAMTAALTEHEGYLGDLDAVAGDGDHGRGMRRGCEAALVAVSGAAAAGAGPRSMLIAAADAWSDRAGGTSGALWGAGLLGFASELADEHLPTARDLARAVATGLRDIQAEGGAVPGDKTLVDALAAFSSVLTACVEDGQHLAAAWSIAADDATTAASATARLEPRLGRARPLAARSLGNPDPGAVSMALCLQAIASALADIDHSTGKEHTQ